MKSSLANRLAMGLTFWAGLALTSTAWAQRGGFGGGFGGSRVGTASSGSASARGTTSQYGGAGTLGTADFTYDPETRNLMVVTDDQTIKQVRDVVNALNRPAPQVLIKVAFVEVLHTKDLDFGVEGGVAGQLNKGSTAYPITGTASNLFNLGGAGTTGAGIYSILGNDFQATLRAIAQAGKSELLSRPSILTRNNETATISLGQQVPLISGTRFDSLGNQINTITYQNVGISLQVTPYIYEDGMVEMAVTPQASVLADRSQWVATSTGSGGTVLSPVINSRAADTVVIVPNGQTVVIGGLMENQDQQSDSKIPILGDIPLLGNLFKHHIKDKSRRELLIFLTPYIVEQPAMLAGMTEAERKNLKLVPQAFSNEELDRFLNGLPKKDIGNEKK